MSALPPPASAPVPRLSERVAGQLRALIAQGNLQAGDRLPPERTLAVRLGVSRTALREAIAGLASQGLLRARVGGGTYVQGPRAPEQVMAAAFAPHLALLRSDPDYRFDVLEIRHALEGMAAWHAALRADAEDHARIEQAHQALLDAQAGQDPAAAARADARFHLAIAEAAHNGLLLQVMGGLFEVLHDNISQSREKLYLSARTCQPLSAQHRALMDAVLAGDAPAARDAAHAHLAFVHDTLRVLEQDQARRRRASRLPSSR